MDVYEILLLILQIATVSAAGAAQPIQQPWSSQVYGPDGPWNAVTISLGSQSVDLAIGSFYTSYFLSSEYCNNATLFGSRPCNAKAAGLVDQPRTSDQQIPCFRPDATWIGGDNGTGPAMTIYPWTATVPITNGPQVQDLCGGLVDSAWLTLPDGTNYPHTLGSLAMGGPAFNQTFGPSSSGQSISYTMIVSSLYERGLIPSSSVGLHVGSGKLGIPGSMYYGGYDRSRALGDIMVTPSQTTGMMPPLFGSTLLDIGIGTALGGSPFNFSSRSGLLAQGNSSIGTSIVVNLSANSPYLYLPRSTCDAIASTIPVTFQSKYGLYFWNVDDPRYTRIVTAASYLYFQFQADNLPNGNMTVKVPWSLLNLTLEQPIIGQPVAYFPCRPYDPHMTTMTPPGTYILGQAFLQAAFLGVDWKPRSPPGNWFLAQAPGPVTPALIDLVSIPDGAQTLGASRTKWEDTWTGHWTALPSATSTVPSAASSNNVADESSKQNYMSTWVKVGIGLGVAVGAAVLFAVISACLYFRKRRAARSAIAIVNQPTAFEKQKLPACTSPKVFVARRPVPMFEVNNQPAIFELHSQRIAELGSQRTPELSSTRV